MGVFDRFRKKSQTEEFPPVVERFKELGYKAISNLDKDESYAALKWAADITASFGAILSDRNRIFESRQSLPDDFDTIKLALCVQMTFYAATDNKQNLDVCRKVYTFLGHFIDITPEEADSMLLTDPGNQMGDDPKAMADQVLGQQELYERSADLAKQNAAMLDRYYEEFFGLESPQQ